MKGVIDMTTRLKAAAKTVWKYLFWTAVAGVVQALIDALPGLDLPILWVPIIAAALKGAATWVATKQEEAKP